MWGVFWQRCRSANVVRTLRGIRGPYADFKKVDTLLFSSSIRIPPPVWGTVLTRVKTLTRVFEGREEPLLRDSNTLWLKNTALLLRLDSHNRILFQGRVSHLTRYDWVGLGLNFYFTVFSQTRWGNRPATSYVERLMRVFREKHVLNSLYLPKTVYRSC